MSDEEERGGRASLRARLLRHVCVTVFIGGIVASAPHAVAQDSLRTSQDISIESTSLSAAIVELSREAGVPIFAASRLTDGRDIEPFSGTYTVRDALQILLEGTGLTVRRDGNGHLVVTEPESVPDKSPGSVFVSRTDHNESDRPRAEAQETAPWIVDKVQVTGIRGALGDALQSKRQADVISDVISSQDLGKFPDQNIAEGLQRVPGVTITRVAGEGQQVILRGLGPEYVSVTVNGVAAPSANTGREFDFDVFASELFSQATIIKTASADRVENGIAGSINLRTARPFDHDGFRLTGGVQSVWTPRANAQDPRTHFAISNTFGDSFGALFAMSYSESSERSDGIRAIGWQSRNFDVNRDGTADYLNVAYPRIPVPISDTYERQRLGVSGSLQYRPSALTEVNLDMLYGEYDRERGRISLNAWPIGRDYNFVALTVDEGGAIATGEVRDVRTSSLARQTVNEQEFFQASLEGKHQVGQWTATALASFSRAVDDEVRDVEFTLANEGRILLDFTDPSIFPEMDYGFDLLDPDAYRFGRVVNTPAKIHNDGYSVHLDVSRPIAGPLWSAVSLGARFEDREHTSSGSLLATEAYRGRVDVASIARPLVSDFAVDLDAPAGFPDAWLVPDLELTLANLPGGLMQGRQDFGNTYAVREKTSAAYIRVDLDSDVFGIPFSGNAGVRAVHTEQESTGFQFLGTEGNPVQYSQNYSDVLPSANVKFQLTDELLLRLSAAKVLTRPDPDDVSPYWLIQPRERRIRLGNPELGPFTATQIDASLEWYFAKDALLFLAAFRKDADSLVAPLDTMATLAELDPAVPPQGPPGEMYSVTTFRNGLGVTVDGIELGYQQPFTFLPEPFDGLGVLANYTYLDSEGVLMQGGVERYLPLLQQSKHSYNIVGYYERDGVSLRAAYNWRDAFLIRPIDRGNDQVFRDEEVYLDLFASYDISDHVTLTFEALNVTDTDVYEYADIKDRFTYFEATGPRFFAGVTFRF